MGLDYIGAENQTDVSIPKYNNKVQNPDMFDTETKAFLPVAGLRQRRATGNLVHGYVILYAWIHVHTRTFSACFKLHMSCLVGSCVSEPFVCL